MIEPKGEGNQGAGGRGMLWRMVTAGLVLSLGCAVPLTVDHAEAAAAQHRAQVAADQQAAQQQLAVELPGSPPDVAAELVRLIGAGDTTSVGLACLMFSRAAAAQFAALNSVSTCAEAVGRLHAQVSDSESYTGDVSVPENAWDTEGDQAEVDGCQITWQGLFSETPAPADPGPLLGLMAMAQQQGHGWLITGYRAC